MVKFYKRSPPEIMTNQEISSVLINMDESIAGLDQGIYELDQTFDNVMTVMDASKHSLDEQIRVLDTVIEVNLPGLSGAYKAPNIWINS